MIKKIAALLITAMVALFALAMQCQDPARAAATLLPNGEQCFQATTPSSGGLYGPITTLGSITGGSGYVSATYTNVPLTGGNGFGAKATVSVGGGVVTGVSVTNPGSHYAVSDTLSAAAANLGGSGSGFSVPVNAVSTTGTGMIGLLGPITAGSAGTSGTYVNVALTGGSGTGATANITVSGGGVTAVTILDPGGQYQVGDTLSAASGNIGGTGGFSVQVSSVTINNALAGGSVFFYIPNTITFKQTWKDAGQTILNTNPVTLDANGCAVIYGTGTYRQVLQDASGNTVWDQLTTDTSAQQNVFWAGNASGTPNAIILTDPGFNATDGSIINFFPISTNTGATTISIASSGYTNIPVVKDTTGGPVALTGGEITVPPSGTPNVVSVLYSAVESNFHILNPIIQSASGTSAPLCGATGLGILPTSGTAVGLNATQVVAQNSSGLTIQRNNVSLSISTGVGNATSTVNGMDGEAPGTNNWLYVWVIDNGAAAGGLLSSASGNGVNPVLPSGYTYKCAMGSIRVDNSGNLMTTVQSGNQAQWVAGTLPVITSSFGSYWTPQDVTAYVPATASMISVAAEFDLSSGALNGTSGTASAGVAPNANYGTPDATSRPPCSSIINATSLSGGSGNSTTTTTNGMICTMLFESPTHTIYTGSAVTGPGSNSSVLSAFGWKDRVNAD